MNHAESWMYICISKREPYFDIF